MSERQNGPRMNADERGVDDALKALLRQALPPSDTRLRRDLWPDVRRRLERRDAPVPWFDWVLAAAAIVWLLLFPEAVFPLLYHL